MSENWIKTTRDRIFSGEDADLYRHIGYFTCWYGQVELSLTMLLAFLTRSSDFVAFEIISKGMDARVKMVRLRELLKLRTPFDPKSALARRLKHFDEKMVPLRNLIAHNGFYSTYDPEPVLHFTSLTKHPNDGRKRIIPEAEPAKQISYLELFAAGYWLNLFYDDLATIFKATPEERVYDLAAPRSWLPPQADAK